MIIVQMLLRLGNVSNLTFNTTGATFDGPEACNQHNSPNLWYVYTATCTGTATISLCGSSFDTLLAVYSGTACANLTLIGCNDDFCNQQSQLTINVVAGKNYWDCGKRIPSNRIPDRANSL